MKDFTIKNQKEKTKHIYLSYSYKDQSIAHRLTDRIRGAGLNISDDVWELKSSDSLKFKIREAISTSDFMIILLSPSSVKSNWIQFELNSALANELSDRAITLIPVLIKDCVIPEFIEDHPYIDLRNDFNKSVNELINRLRAIPEIDYSKLDGMRFENLIGDLLSELGFSVISNQRGPDFGFDFTAVYKSCDPFGLEQKETWFVEVKFYREERVSISALQRILGQLMTTNRNGKGLIVTNGKLTSISREFLTNSNSKFGYNIRVLDGMELTNLLVQHPKLIEQYFGQSKP